MKLYRQRPPLYEAIQVTEANREALRALPGVRAVQEGHYLVERIDGGDPDVVGPGWWLYRLADSGGEFQPIPDESFSAIFEEAP